MKLKFDPEGEGTRVALVHEGLERVPDAHGQRSQYDAGWGDLLGKLLVYTE